MVQCCCVPGCYNKAGMTSLRGSSRLSFHCFPQNNDRLAAQWRRCIGREDVSRRMRICSDHFLASDFLGGGRHRKLRRGVVPSIIPAPPSPLHPHSARMNVWKLHSQALEVTPGDQACRDVASSTSSSSRDSSPAPPTPASIHQQSPWSIQQQQQREAAALALLGLQTTETAWSQRETAAMGLLRLQTSSWSMQQRDAALGLLRLQAAGQPSHISPPVQWHQQQREIAALGLLGLQVNTPAHSMQEQREAAAMGLLGLHHGFQVGQQLFNNPDPRQRGMLNSSLTQLMHMHALEHQYKLMQLHLLQRTAASTD